MKAVNFIHGIVSLLLVFTSVGCEYSAEQQAISLAKKYANVPQGETVVSKVVFRSRRAASEVIHCLGAIKSLRSIGLIGFRPSEDHLEGIAVLENINSLVLSNAITDKDLEYLQGMVALNRLKMMRNQIDGSGLVYLTEMQDLKFLDLSLNELDNEGLKFLPELISLEELRLSNTKVDDEDMAFLKRQRNLRSVDLMHTQITVAGVMELVPLLQLIRIDVSDEFYRENRAELGKFARAHVEAKQAARLRGENVPTDEQSPFFNLLIR